jgi:DNA polymerase
MSESRPAGREEIVRYLVRRGSQAGGILYKAREALREEAPLEKEAHQSDARTHPPRPEETIVKTSPVETPRPADLAAPARKLAEGYSRDTRPSTQAGLFAEPAGGGDLHDADLTKLERIVAGCTKCDLAETRTNTVFGDGSSSAKLVFVGEAPGRDEDKQGLPFVGRAGKLLDKMIEAIGFTRGEVYIANILKCRPPGNRDPKEDEVAACEDYLARQIELLDPVLICALGRVAGQNLLGTRAPLKALRDGIHHYNGIRVVVTYHPAALLRNPHWKKPAWEDLQMLKALYDEFTTGRK